jgi:hypothetical protein
VDVYADWIDACDAVQKDGGDGSGRLGVGSQREIDHAGRGGATAEEGYGGDDFVVEDDVDAEGEYADEE